MTLEYRMLRAGDCAVLDRVADDVFDNAIEPTLAQEFVDDERHHLAVAIDDGIGCTQAWVLTDRDNTAAMRLYESVGGYPGTREHVMFEFQLR